MQRRETDAPPADSSVVEESGGSTQTIPHGSQNVLCMRIIKTSALILFLCGLVVAFVYAINANKESEDENSHVLNSTEKYSVYRNQYSEKGHFILELMNPDTKTHIINDTSFWYQNDDEKKLLYKMNDSTVIWVFEERSFWVTVDGNEASLRCVEDASVGYIEFIRQLSLSGMYNRHSEKRQIRGNTEVYVFDGEPVLWVHQKIEPYLTQAFAAIDDGRLIEFQNYYNTDTTNGWYSLTYTFYDMKGSAPSDEKFNSLPNNCEPAPPK